MSAVLRSGSARRFNEAEELFGSPPPDSERLLDIVAVLFSDDMRRNALQTSYQGMAVADEYEGQCYSDLLGPAFAMCEMWATDEQFENLSNFFHLATAFGEARMLTKLLAVTNTRAALSMKAAGNA